MTKQEILSTFHFRHACKEFDRSKIIPKDDFEFILETARLSPSSYGLEPWHFVVVQDKNLREQLKSCAWGALLKLDTASHFVLCLTMKQPLMKWDSDYIPRFMRAVQHMPEDVIKMRCELIENTQKYDSDLLDERKLFDWTSKQSFIAMGNMMTAAAMIGIDSCPIGGFKQEETEALLQSAFAIDTKLYGISYMLAFGYRLHAPKTKTRRPIEEVVSWK